MTAFTSRFISRAFLSSALMAALWSLPLLDLRVDITGNNCKSDTTSGAAMAQSGGTGNNNDGNNNGGGSSTPPTGGGGTGGGGNTNGDSSGDSTGVNNSDPGNPAFTRSSYFLRYPVAKEFAPSNSPWNGADQLSPGTLQQGGGQSLGPGMINIGASGPIQMWPVIIPSLPPVPVPSFRDQAIQKDLFPTSGYPLTGTSFETISRYNDNRMLEEMFDPERSMWMMNTMATLQATKMANNTAGLGQNQAVSAVEHVQTFLTNFTNEAADPGNVWHSIKDNLFVPMALLLLFLGAVLTQVRAIVAQGSGILGNISPIEGLTRSVIAVFLIPATSLVMNYGIDVSNSVAASLANGYWQQFGRDMYQDAECAQKRAFPINPPQNNRNAIIPTPADSAPTSGPIENLDFNVAPDPCLLASTPPAANPNGVPDEEEQFIQSFSRLMVGMGNATLSVTWNVLCAFQTAYLYYLWCMGPLVAALWVWPLQTMRNALSSWFDGVITLCFWSLFWNTAVLLMAVFYGINTNGGTGTMYIAALNLLATLSVRFAFNFTGLMNTLGFMAESMAMQAAGQMSGSGAQQRGGQQSAAGAPHPGAPGVHPGGIPQHPGAGVLAHGAGAGAGAPGGNGNGTPMGVGSSYADAPAGFESGLAAGAATGVAAGAIGPSLAASLAASGYGIGGAVGSPGMLLSAGAYSPAGTMSGMEVGGAGGLIAPASAGTDITPPLGGAAAAGGITGGVGDGGAYGAGGGLPGIDPNGNGGIFVGPPTGPGDAPGLIPPGGPPGSGIVSAAFQPGQNGDPLNFNNGDPLNFGAGQGFSNTGDPSAALSAPVDAGSFNAGMNPVGDLVAGGAAAAGMSAFLGNDGATALGTGVPSGELPSYYSYPSALGSSSAAGAEVSPSYDQQVSYESSPDQQFYSGLTQPQESQSYSYTTDQVAAASPQEMLSPPTIASDVVSSEPSVWIAPEIVPLILPASLEVGASSAAPEAAPHSAEISYDQSHTQESQHAPEPEVHSQPTVASNPTPQSIDTGATSLGVAALTYAMGRARPQPPPASMPSPPPAPAPHAVTAENNDAFVEPPRRPGSLQDGLGPLQRFAKKRKMPQDPPPPSGLA